MKLVMLAMLISMYPIFCSESIRSQHYVCLAISKTSYTYGWGKEEKEARLDYQRTRGIRSQQKIPNGKIFGFKKFDKVKYLNQTYFVKGRNSKGYATLMDINQQTIKLKPIPKFSLLTRISARTTTLVV